jgi:ribosomal protein L39E
MGRIKLGERKLRLIKVSKIKGAPVWASIRRFGLKRARTRRIFVAKEKQWRRSKLKE